MRHQTISFVKSVIRLLGYALLLINVPVAVMILIASEVVGIVEEVGHE